jgi:abequosyltransferase
MDKNILLTIAIPTFNRAEYLDICLSQFAKQIEPYNDIIEVIVTNNFSSDNTSQIVDKYHDQFSILRYEIQKENIGADSNIEWCYRNSNGKYLWVFGDDDLILDNKLSIIVELLKNNNLDILFVKGYGFANDHQGEYPTRKAVFEKSPYKHFANKKKYIAAVNYFITFVSGNIVNKEIIPPDFSCSRFISTNLVQVGWILEAYIEGKEFGVVNELVMAIKTNNTGGYKLFETFSTNFNSILEFMNVNRGLSRSVNRIIHFNMLLTFFPQFILQSRINNQQKFSEENIKQVLKTAYSNNIWFWVFTMPLFILPIGVGKFYQKHILNNINRVKNVFV